MSKSANCKETWGSRFMAGYKSFITLMKRYDNVPADRR
ncbi:hypothetical protein HMPREF9412_2822 [Paenibacillus sp. HGF5]|nr:hypothetical protein HMPREF9412_2822 [Paenibacillus sp. HGF5]